MQRDPDDEIDEFLRSLPPAPQSWVSRAEEMPLLEKALQILRNREADHDEAAMNAALMEVGLEPDERRVRALARLRDLREG